jgi:hypothetical protein
MQCARGACAPLCRRPQLQTIDCHESPESGRVAPIDITERKRSSGKVRYVRIIGVCAATLCASAATTLALASPALASKKVGPEGVFEKFNECPLGATQTIAGEQYEVGGCIFGEAGKESFFQAGKVTVSFKKPVKLDIGFDGDRGRVPIPPEEVFPVFGARNGVTISKEAEPAPSLTEGLDAEKLEEPEKKRYEEYIAAGKSTKATETIELATPATEIFLSETHILEEKGEGFGFDVMIHIENKFLGKNCYVGSTVHPIDVPFTTGETHPEPPNTPIHGTAGSITTEGEGEILVINDQELVNNEYAAPGVSGCGINGGADAALDAGLGLPSPAGSNTTILHGTLYQTGSESVEEHIKL